MNRIKQVGFSQRIRLEWLQYAADLMLTGIDKVAINDTLQDVLKDKLSIGGDAKRGNREKAITIIMKIWVNVPNGLDSFRDAALSLLQNLPRGSHIAVHWGMVMAVYPFWGIVAENTGRLLCLQSTAAASHIQRRIREQYGERETVSRATRRIIRTFVDWNILKETTKKGVYQQGNILDVKDKDLISWLIEAFLISNGINSKPLRSIVQSPTLFPFNISFSRIKQSITSDRIEIIHQGIDDEIVALCGDRMY